MIKLCGSATGIGAGQTLWGRGESNPHWVEPKSTTECRIAGHPDGQPAPRSKSRNLRHQRAGIRTQTRTHPGFDVDLAGRIDPPRLSPYVTAHGPLRLHYNHSMIASK